MTTAGKAQNGGLEVEALGSTCYEYPNCTASWVLVTLSAKWAQGYAHVGCSHFSNFLA